MKYVRDEANNLYEALDKEEIQAAFVAQAEGKDLSSNDYTDEDKETVQAMAAGTVTGIKGDAEAAFRTGQVNLTPEHVGAAAKEIIAPAETSPATAAHVKGEYITYNGKLYEVIAPIAAGNTLGSSNISETNVGAKLKNLSNNIANILSSISGLTPTGIGHIEQLTKHFMIFNCTSSVPINSSVSMPVYTKGIFVTGGGDSAAVDGFLLAVDAGAGLYVAFRNGSSWNYAKKL